LYSTLLPSPLFYGTLGSIIGHEIMHSLGLEQILLNYAGNPESILSSNTDKEFLNQVKCLQKEYTNHGVNGNITADENISDNAGVTASFNAMQKSLVEKNQLRLPGISQWTSEQIFWIGWGLSWCESVEMPVC